jgi:hypothetical protein
MKIGTTTWTCRQELKFHIFIYFFKILLCNLCNVMCSWEQVATSVNKIRYLPPRVACLIDKQFHEFYSTFQPFELEQAPVDILLSSAPTRSDIWRNTVTHVHYRTPMFPWITKQCTYTAKGVRWHTPEKRPFFFMAAVRVWCLLGSFFPSFVWPFFFSSPARI